MNRRTVLGQLIGGLVAGVAALFASPTHPSKDNFLKPAAEKGHHLKFRMEGDHRIFYVEGLAFEDAAAFAKSLGEQVGQGKIRWYSCKRHDAARTADLRWEPA